MIFGDIPVEDAEGAYLAHAQRHGRINLSKGRRLAAADVAALRTAGVTSVTVARLEPDDVHEDEAAGALAHALCGEDLETTAPFTGRANLYAAAAGLVEVDVARLDALNALDESITVATLPAFVRTEVRQMAATIKIIPFSVPRRALDGALSLARNGGPMLRLARFRPHKAALIHTMLPSTKPSLFDKAVAVTRARLAPLSGELTFARAVPHREEAVAAALQEAIAAGVDLHLVMGASAIVDRRDVTPAGIERAGGEIEHFGMPVDPGNLLLFGRLDGKPAIGLPGCARSPKFNGFDMVLERLAAGLPVGRVEIQRMGAGGLLAEVSQRGLPRASDLAEKAPAAPRVAALVLAAGRSSRMGADHKLLADLEGSSMIARTMRAVLGSKVASVVVVTGHRAAEVRAAAEAEIAPADKARVAFVHNPDFAEGLSTSIGAGLRTTSSDVDAALVCLGDMPAVTSAQIDRLLAAFNPTEGRAICVPTAGGKRGNPALFARRFFEEMAQVKGDVGARHLIGEHADAVCEVEMEGDGVLLDLDTPEALAAYRTRTAAGADA